MNNKAIGFRWLILLYFRSCIASVAVLVLLSAAAWAGVVPSHFGSAADNLDRGYGTSVHALPGSLLLGCGHGSEGESFTVSFDDAPWVGRTRGRTLCLDLNPDDCLGNRTLDLIDHAVEDIRAFQLILDQRILLGIGSEGY